jgi:hypothetical protein
MGKREGWIDKAEFSAMDPSDAGPGRFYQIFKVHKDHAPGSIPPPRPIISGNGSITENISKFVDFHAKPLVQNLPSYIQDTPDFLRKLEDLNARGPIPNKAILLTIDVSSLYTNIPKVDGLSAMKDALNSRPDQSVPTNFLIELMDIVLSFNIFEFDKELFLQRIGTAMGTSSAPTYANLEMGVIDEALKTLARNLCEGMDPILAYLRYIDDIFMIYTGPVATLLDFLSQINNVHPTLKFTFTMTCPFPCSTPPDTPHDCFCHTTRSLPFLDTLVSIKDGQLVTDLYRKPSDRCMYLLPSSAHPAHITTNTPYSLAYRLVRICSERPTLLLRFQELTSFLQSREYPLSVIERALDRARLVTREEALRKVKKKPLGRVVFAVDYHPALPSYSSMLKKSWNVMVKDSYMKEVFPRPPMVAYRQPKFSSLRQLLVKSKVPPPRRTSIVIRLKKCLKPRCSTCSFVSEHSVVKSSASNFSLNVNKPVTCDSCNIVYCITCTKPQCKLIQYIGETGRRLKDRFSQHIGYVKKPDLLQPTGAHFNLPGHDVSHMKISVIEQCNVNSRMYRQTRESHFINMFNTKYKGLNKK